MDKAIKSQVDLAQIRARLCPADAPTFWRSLDELSDEPLNEWLRDEFPRLGAAVTGMNRREFMQLMGASLALAGVSACGVPEEEILPYVQGPEALVPGKPLFFPTATTLGGIASGVLVESHMGRPTKIEGNPGHPVSLGATDVFAQASVLQLWDPNRSQAVKRGGEISTWESFLAAINDRQTEFKREHGAGLRVLTGTITSPTLTWQFEALLQKHPRAQWHQYEPITRDAVYAGSRVAYGEALEPQYHFDKARVILSLDADFLGTMPGRLRYARDFTQGRRVELPRTEMNRLYILESSPTITGAMADHRWPCKAGRIEDSARRIATLLGAVPPTHEPRTPFADEVLKALANDLEQHRGASLVIAGEHQPPLVHALAHAMNEALGNTGRTVTFTEPVSRPINQLESLRRLTDDMMAGQVHTLIILGGNPVYDSPVDIAFGDALAKVDFSAHLSLYDDETSAVTGWHIAETHYLETWGDARAIDGAVTIQQPLIAPLYQSRSAHEVLGVLAGDWGSSPYDTVRRFWRRHQGGDFEAFWREALREGVVKGSALPGKLVSIRRDLPSRLSTTPATAQHAGIEIIFKADPTIWDGRFAANAWLQELPKPMTSLTWDNAALISPSLAKRLALRDEELIELRLRGRTVRAPVLIVPGHPDDSVTVSLGYGRERGAGSGNGAGFNAYRLRHASAPWFDHGLEIVKTGEAYALARTQEHHRMAGRDIVREATLEEFKQTRNFAHDDPHKNPPFPSLYPQRPYNDYKWGMTVNLNTCIGCKACTIACQAENNIPVVGKTQVAMGRELHWLRVDHYYKGPPDNPDTYFQPVPCMHCEHAPCEPVCPVQASVHDEDGLNLQVYNRCIGTRYCSNNCPYKVRRFNFLQYANLENEHLAAVRNPDVTVRSRGVMEKCTYCLQRINAAKLEAEKQGRGVRDGEVVTACQAVCPTNAIIFGDLNDADSRVSKSKRDPLNYALLAELGTRPRTTYLAKLRNPSPEIGGE